MPLQKGGRNHTHRRSAHCAFPRTRNSLPHIPESWAILLVIPRWFCQGGIYIHHRGAGKKGKGAVQMNRPEGCYWALDCFLNNVTEKRLLRYAMRLLTEIVLGYSNYLLLLCLKCFFQQKEPYFLILQRKWFRSGKHLSSCGHKSQLLLPFRSFWYIKNSDQPPWNLSESLLDWGWSVHI